MTPLLREIARYLGYGRTEPDPEVAQRIAFCLKALEVLPPRHVSRRMALDTLDLQSQDLARHLAGCREGFLFAATLGVQADTLLRRWSADDMSLAVVGQACAAALLEQYCDACMERLRAALAPGLYLRPRFSPGYGDFSLSYQPLLLNLLDAGRRIGLSLTAGGMLAPTKSVTAVVGITEDNGSCHDGKCARCPNLNCPFREEQP